mmetsp:Transcript_27007/g.34997  ORF Transcript_27007/g.34997 Transcript_27007/m.34997 type:complete len:1147 (+) Transcript_27007:149-3589(+)
MNQPRTYSRSRVSVRNVNGGVVVQNIDDYTPKKELFHSKLFDFFPNASAEALYDPIQMDNATLQKNVWNLTQSVTKRQISWGQYFRGIAILYFQSLGIQFIMMCLAITSCVTYVIQTYYPEQNARLYQNLEIFMFAAFLTDFLLSFTVSTSGIKYCISTNGVIDFLSLLPIIEVLMTGTELGFLRVMRSIKILRILRLHQSVTTKSAFSVRARKQVNALTVKITRLALTMFTIVFIASGICHTIEVAYKSYEDLEAFSDAENGILEWHDALYYIVVTLSTVGYGDIGPINPVSRLVIVATILIFWVISPMQVNSVLEALATRHRHREAYIAHAPHIVITGGVTASCLDEVLQELFHDDHGDIMLGVRVVTLVNKAPDLDMKRLISLPRYKHTLQYIEGNPRNPHDLLLAAVHRARAVLVFSDFAQHASDTTYEASVLDAISVARFVSRMEGDFDQTKESNASNLNIVAQVHSKRTKNILHESGVRSVLNVGELQMAILAMGTVWNGFIALCLNLFQSHTTGASEFQEASKEWWQLDYMKGTDYQLFMKDVPLQGGSKWIGLVFGDAAWHMYNRTTVLLVAVVLGQRVFAYPGNTFTFSEGDNVKVFVIARSDAEASLAVNSLQSEEDKMFNMTKQRHSALDDHVPSKHHSSGGSPPRFDAKHFVESHHSNDDTATNDDAAPRSELDKLPKVTFPNLNKGISEDLPPPQDVSEDKADNVVSDLDEEVGIGYGNDKFSSLKGIFRKTQFKAQNNDVNESAKTIVSRASRFSMELDNLRTTKDMEHLQFVMKSISQLRIDTPYDEFLKVVMRAKSELDRSTEDRTNPMPDDLKNHIVIVGSLDFVEYFLAPLQKISGIPVVLLHEDHQNYMTKIQQLYNETLIDMKNVYHVIGSSKDRNQLEKTRIRYADKVVILGGKSRSSRERIDEETLLTTIEIEQMLEHEFYEKHIVTELVLEESVYFLGQGTGESNSSHASSAPMRLEDIQLFKKNFARSEIDDHSQSGSWPLFAAGRLFSEAMLNVLTTRLFFSPLELKFWESILQLSDEEKEEDEGFKQIYGSVIPGEFAQVRVADLFPGGTTYLTLFRHFLQMGALAIGLYRAKGVNGSLLPYVQINPQPNTKVRYTDQVFILKSPESSMEDHHLSVNIQS